MNETVNVVTTKTTEIGQKTWGIMKGVMALASQKVEEYTKEGSSGWKNNDSWPRSENERNGYYQEFGKESSSNGWNNTSGGGQKFNSVSSGSWDDWDSSTDGRKDTGNGTASQNGDTWAGWDDNKDDFYHTTSGNGNNNKPVVGYNGNSESESEWTGGGFR